MPGSLGMRPAPDPDERRLALLVATTAYRDPTLRHCGPPRTTPRSSAGCLLNQGWVVSTSLR